MRFPWLHGEGVSEVWRAQIFTDAIQRIENNLAVARREGRLYSSYAAWAARLERELAMLIQLAKEENSGERQRQTRSEADV